MVTVLLIFLLGKDLYLKSHNCVGMTFMWPMLFREGGKGGGEERLLHSGEKKN